MRRLCVLSWALRPCLIKLSTASTLLLTAASLGQERWIDIDVHSDLSDVACSGEDTDLRDGPDLHTPDLDRRTDVEAADVAVEEHDERAAPS